MSMRTENPYSVFLGKKTQKTKTKKPTKTDVVGFYFPPIPCFTHRNPLPSWRNIPTEREDKSTLIPSAEPSGILPALETHHWWHHNASLGLCSQRSWKQLCLLVK